MSNQETEDRKSKIKIIVILSIMALFFGVFYFALSNVGGPQKVKVRDIPVFYASFIQRRWLCDF